MNQSELKAFFSFCESRLVGFEISQCDESEHYYLYDVCIGGYAGDRQDFFFNHCDELARALRMFDAYKAVE